MKIAYLIDKEAIGGGNDYIRRQMAAHSDDSCRVFYADRGECTAKAMNDYGANLISVNHLRALVQLFRNPFVRPQGEVVFTVHGIHLRKYDFLPQTILNRIKRILRLLLEQKLYHRCSRLIALTPTDANDIHRLYGEDLSVRVEPNSICTSELSAAPTDLRWPPDSFAYVMIARNDFQKGQDILFAALELAAKRLRATGSRVLLIGGAEVPASIADLVENAGLIPDAGVYMTCGRTLIAPSRWEGMPYLLLEAVARGRDIIAADCPGNRDVLAGYGKARMFPAGDAASLSEMLK